MKRIPGPVDWGLLVLRLVLGITFILHGAQKLFGAFGGPGIAGFAEALAQMGLPGPPVLWAYLAALAEFGGGLAVLLGVLTEFGAAAIAATMIVAIWKVHGPNGFFLSSNPPGYEYNLMILAVCAALILAGPGWIALWDPFRYRRGARSGPGWAAAEG
jgi:putative oxidoreductase